jgi:hypothetical protein
MELVSNVPVAHHQIKPEETVSQPTQLQLQTHAQVAFNLEI